MKLSKEWIIVLIVSLFVFATTSIAEQKYNPYTGDWETASPDEEEATPRWCRVVRGLSGG